MNLKNKVLNHWHVPTATVAFFKFLLENRQIVVDNNLDLWKEQLKEAVLTTEEQELLESLIKRIDPHQTQFDMDVLLYLVRDTVIRYENNHMLIRYLQNVTYDQSWNDWYRYARGSIINLDKIEIASATLPKFHNVDEKPETSFHNILRKMEKGQAINYIKEDGSNVSVSYDDDVYLYNTPGSMNSTQVYWAKEFLSKKEDFLNDLKTSMNHLTFIFEYVGPENRVVVWYPKTDMILLHVIDKNDGRIVSYEEMLSFANKYEFTPGRVVPFTFEELFNDRHNVEKYQASEHEGWIIRIDDENGTFFAKLKCEDYLRMHRLISDALNPRWILDIMQNETFDDAYANLENDEIKRLVKIMADRINSFDETKKEEFRKIGESIPEELWVNEEIVKKYQMFLSLVQETDASDRVKYFLEYFSKGKKEDPKEEIRAKAASLIEEKLFDTSRMDDFDAYKGFATNRMREWLAEFKPALEEYVYFGKTAEKFSSILETLQYKGIKNIPRVDEWEDYFAKYPDEYLRLANIMKEKLSPDFFEVHAYANAKRGAEKEIETTFSKVRQMLSRAIYYQEENMVTSLIDKSWIISDDLLNYMNEKEAFENNVNTQFGESGGAILKEYYRMLRGIELDNSYTKAKELFESFPVEVKNQVAFYQARGKFSAYVNKNVKKEYHDFIYKMFAETKEERLKRLREQSFLNYLRVVIDPSVELQAFDVDFTNIYELTKDIAIDE